MPAQPVAGVDELALEVGAGPGAQAGREHPARHPDRRLGVDQRPAHQLRVDAVVEAVGPRLAAEVVDEPRLAAVRVRTAQRRLVGHPEALERRHRAERELERVDTPDVDTAGDDGVEDVLVEEAQRVAGLVGGEVGALELDPALAVGDEREDVAARVGARGDESRAQVRPGLELAEPEQLAPARVPAVEVVAKGDQAPEAARSISSPSGRVTTMSTSIRTIVSCGWASGATIFESHGSRRCGGSTSLTSEAISSRCRGPRPRSSR